MILAVSGHRDSVITPTVHKKLKDFFDTLTQKHRSIVLLDALADGADQCVAEIALKYENVTLEVPLPFEKNIYLESIENQVRFEGLYAQAQKRYPIPPRYDNPYENLGRYLAKNADMLLVLWDGNYNDKAGGTGEVIRYARALHRPIIRIDVTRQNA